MILFRCELEHCPPSRLAGTPLEVPAGFDPYMLARIEAAGFVNELEALRPLVMQDVVLVRGSSLRRMSPEMITAATGATRRPCTACTAHARDLEAARRRIAELEAEVKRLTPAPPPEDPGSSRFSLLEVDDK